MRKEILKQLNHAIIYPLLDSEWMSPIQVISKKTCAIVIRNGKDVPISLGGYALITRN